MVCLRRQTVLAPNIFCGLIGALPVAPNSLSFLVRVMGAGMEYIDLVKCIGGLGVVSVPIMIFSPSLVLVLWTSSKEIEV